MLTKYICKNCKKEFVRCSSQGNPTFCCADCCVKYKNKQPHRDNKKWYAEYYIRNQKKLLQNSSAHYNKNKEKILKKESDYRKTPHGKAMIIARKYNVSYEYATSLLKITKCQICGDDRYMAVDHCHQCGVVRGRLCYRCNRAIGALGDTVELLEKAVKYLKKHKHD